MPHRFERVGPQVTDRFGVELTNRNTTVRQKAHVASQRDAARVGTRELLTLYLARGYRPVEFFLDRASRRGSYLLVDSRV